MTITLEAPTSIQTTSTVLETVAVEAPNTETVFSARQVPWAKIGTTIDDPTVNAARAAELGGLDFDVELRPASFGSVSDKGNRTSRNVPSRRAIVRADNEQFFTFASSDYKPVQYREAFTFMDGVNPNYVAAGAMSGGRQGFMVVQMPGLESLEIDVNGVSDPHDIYVVLRTSHDLSKAVEISVMPLRGLCMNMLALPSLVRGAQQSWSFKHVGDVKGKLDQAQATLSRTTRYAEVFAGMVRQLGSVTVDRDDATIILKRVLPDRPRREDQIESILTIADTDPTIGFGGTGWGLTNAVSSYFQWSRGTGTRTPQSEFTSGLNGDTRKYVGRTAQLLMAR